jgi:hypothetical protein
MHTPMMDARAVTTQATRTAMLMWQSMRMRMLTGSGRRRRLRPDLASAPLCTLAACHFTPKGPVPLQCTSLSSISAFELPLGSCGSTEVAGLRLCTARVRLKTLVLRWLPVATNKAIGDMDQAEGASPIKAVIRSKARAWALHAPLTRVLQ